MAPNGERLPRSTSRRGLSLMRTLLTALVLLTGCYLGRYPVTPTVVDGETFQAIADEGTGTAFAIGHHTALTAGHVCYMEAIDGHDQLWLRTGGAIPMAIRARVIAWEMTPGSEGDLCVLHTDADLGPGLILADHEPRIGAPDTIIGYPRGHYSSTTGVYAGNGRTTNYSDHGSSGAPVFTQRGVYGVVTQGWPDGTLHAEVTGVTEIKRFLDELGVSYDISPPNTPGMDPVQ